MKSITNCLKDSRHLKIWKSKLDKNNLSHFGNSEKDFNSDESVPRYKDHLKELEFIKKQARAVKKKAFEPENMKEIAKRIKQDNFMTKCRS